MDINLFLKSGFMGFAIGAGAQMLIFFLSGLILKIRQNNFRRVFLLGAITSFLLVDGFLYYKIVFQQVEQPQLFLSGCIGGWLGATIFGITQLKPILMDSLKK
jgi:hypothetical protein